MMVGDASMIIMYPKIKGDDGIPEWHKPGWNM